MERNNALFFAVANQIRLHPEAHDQAWWGHETECGTSHCIAGWATVLDGRQDLMDAHLAAEKDRQGRSFGDPCWRPAWDLARHSGEAIALHARQALGLTEDEADALFDSEWTVPSYMTVAEALEKIGAGADIAEVTVDYAEEDEF